MRRRITFAGSMVLMLAISGCGSHYPSTSGTVTQGPISGATVFADKAPYNGTLDAGEVSAITGSNGKFNIVIPDNYGSYRFVSKNGTDTTSGRPGGTLYAPAGAQNVTPLTTLVALDTTGTVAAKLKSLGITSYDIDLSQGANTTPAAVAFVKTIEAAIDSVSSSVSTDAARQAIQTAMATTLASTLASPSFSMATLTTTTGGATTAMQTLVLAAANAVITTPPANVTFSNTALADITPSLNLLVSNVVTSVGSVAPTGTQSETAVASTVAAFVRATVQEVVETVATGGATVVADTTLPTIVSVVPANNATNVAANATVVVTFSEPMLSTSITATGGTVTWSTDLKTATFTKTGGWATGSNTFTVSASAKDLVGNSLATPTTVTFTVVGGTTGTTGGTGGGTGIGF